MNTEEWVHCTVHKALKDRLEMAERNAERDRKAFNMLCEAFEEIEKAVGIDTKGLNGPSQAVEEVKKMAESTQQEKPQ